MFSFEVDRDNTTPTAETLTSSIMGYNKLITQECQKGQGRQQQQDFWSTAWSLITLGVKPRNARKAEVGNRQGQHNTNRRDAYKFNQGVCIAQSESIIIKTHSKTIVLQDDRFYLLVFFLFLLLFTVPRCKTMVLKDSRKFLLVFLQFLKTMGGYGFTYWFYVWKSNLIKHIIKICVYSNGGQSYFVC